MYDSNLYYNPYEELRSTWKIHRNCWSFENCKFASLKISRIQFAAGIEPTPILLIVFSWKNLGNEQLSRQTTLSANKTSLTPYHPHVQLMSLHTFTLIASHSSLFLLSRPASTKSNSQTHDSMYL